MDVSFSPERQQRPRRPRQPRRVIVIGAGMSGLACARELQSRHYDVLVVEARGRLGGRLKGGLLQVPATASASASSSEWSSPNEQPQPQHAVDLGGALIHGINDNPVYRLTRDLNIPTRSVQECLLMNDSGWPVDPKEDAAVQAVFNECLDETFRRTTSTTSATNNNTNNVHAPRTTRSSVLSTTTSSFGDLFHQVRREKGVADTALLQWHQANLEVSCGAGLDRLGWQWNDDEPYGFDGDHVALPTSWKAVVEALGEKLDHVCYDTAVTRIQVIHPPPEVLAAQEAAVAVAEQQQQKRNSNHHHHKKLKIENASFTKRLGSPARNNSAAASWSSSPLSSPSSSMLLLPTRQSRRLRGEDASVRRSGRSNKGTAVERFTVELEPPERQKKRQKRTPLPSHQPTSFSSSNSVVQVTVQQGPNKEPLVLQADAVVCTLPLGILQLSPSEPGGIVFDPPLPAKKQQAIHRLGTGLLNKCTLSFSHVFWQDSDFLGLAEGTHSYLVLNVAAYTGKPILMFMYGGNFAKEMEEWTDQQVVEDCLNVLKRICGRQLPVPLDYYVTRWGYEQYSRMAFTYIPPGVDGFTELCTMSQPINDYKEEIPVLMFAGEHTTPYHPSTIHGAFLSGIREAYRLDCALNPEAMGNLKFSEEELYQRTFSVEQQQQQTVGDPAVPQLNGGHYEYATKKNPYNNRHKQHRRRGASGVMKLRKQTQKVVHPTESVVAGAGTADHHTTTAAAATTMSSPTRRSQRSTAAGQVSVAHMNGDRDEQTGLMTESELTALEDRILLRGVESYGPDYDFLLANVMRVHGSSSIPNHHQIVTASQVRQRCQQLARSNKLSNKRPRPKSSLKSWAATFAAPSVSSNRRLREKSSKGRSSLG